MNPLFELSAHRAAQLIKDKKISSVELTGACLERISERDDELHAWQLVDFEGAMAAAVRADNNALKEGLLHGVPVGLKDIIDTAELPTTYGSRAFSHHQPTRNADCVNLLQEHGAIIVGKTVTTEFAFFAPGPTVNPHNHAHTPGGSSSGSAAAVADFHVPLALGTQTAGSIVRPASFNGILGYKPSFDCYSNAGVHPLAPSLDTLGPFARELDDLHLLNRVLARNKPSLALDTRKPTRVVVVRTPYWEQASEEMRFTFEAFADAISGDGIEVVDAATIITNLDADLEFISECQLLLMAVEAKEILAPIAQKYGEVIRPETKSLIEQGLQAPTDAKSRIENAKAKSENMMSALASAGDLILTPSSLGAAPPGIRETGDPIFNRAWTFAHAPCINIPLARNESHLPIGAQVVAAHGQDEALLRLAKYLVSLSPYQILPPG
jgi:Asp-tRNA(Asn)/Glu-tRNA(Gln) amidotransferase A subunit family amidase